MAARRPKDVSAWLGGNRGTVQSGGGKPMGIVDDIAKGIKDIASPWLPAAPGQNKSVTQAQGLARAAAETLDQTVTGGLVKAGTQGNKALAKQAAINAAALGAGYVAGKAIQIAANAAAETGVPAQIVNKLTKKTVVVHGSPISNIKILQPKSGASIGNTTPHVFVQEVTRRNMFDESLAASASHYAHDSGSIYISNVNKKDLTSVEKLYGGNYPNYLVTNKPVNVRSEIKIPSGLKKNDRLEYVSQQIVSSSKQAGVGSLDIHPIDNLRESKRFVTELAEKNFTDLQRRIRWAKYDRIINKAKKR